MTEAEAIQRAVQYLSDQEYQIEDMESAIKALEAGLRFKLARRVLNKMIHNYPKNVWYKQRLAFCTYKDQEIPPSVRFDKALKLLESIGLRDPSNKDSKTLTLGGTVYKRMWQCFGQIQYLYEALSFYRAAHDRNPKEDCGYGGINAAFILQLLTHRALIAAKRSGTYPIEAELFERQAENIRRRIVAELEDRLEKDPSLEKNYWFVVTLAEAHLGLAEYEKADKLLAKSRLIEVSEWERQTTFRQLICLLRFQGIQPPSKDVKPEWWHKSWQVVANVTGKWSGKAFSYSPGKVGLALSGGGLKASLYHLGVLARLAEMDVLRTVEVLSTVSGGSIIGTYYYLELKNLLENKGDDEIQHEDYIKIIKRIQLHFLESIQKNLRALTLSNFVKNLKMLFSKKYGRLHRLGELYEEILFSKVMDSHPKGQPRYMNDLIIKPKWEEDFKPKFSNWRRSAKVPVLLVNAASLNTGHAWQFTARSMGENPGLLGRELDKNSYYRRVWYDEAPTEELKNYRLGYAIAASTCVSRIFDPLILEGLYPGTTVRLVDGGIYDNQGIAALLDESCCFILCSDASGQMGDKRKPANSLSSVFLRTSLILNDRVREAGYKDLQARIDSRSIKGLFFIHLKKDLYSRTQDWINCQNPTSVLEREDNYTPYNIDPEIQRLLSELRTDIDSFTDVEAYSLMCSGYLMTEQQFKKLQKEHEKSGEQGTWGGFDINAPRENWGFLEMEPLIKLQNGEDSARKDLEKQLRAGSSLTFKMWRLDWKLRLLFWLIVFAAGILSYQYIDIGHFLGKTLVSLSLTIGNFIVILGISLIIILLSLRKWTLPEEIDLSPLYKVFIAVFGFLGAKIHLWCFNGIFLNRGRVDRLLKKMKKV